MAINCTFHRSKSAHFQCHECGSAFCEQCLSIRETGGIGGAGRHYFCPGCNIPVEMLSLSNILEPFQKKLSKFFLYPFQPTPLILTLVLSILVAVFPMSSLVRLFVWVVMMKYAYAVLIETGQGSLKAPQVTVELVNSDVMQVFKQYVIFGIFGFLAAYAFGYSGVIGGFIFITIILVAIPAIIMLLVSTNSILHAINPMYFLGLISRIGWPYFLMYLFLFFLMAGPAAFFSFLPHDFLPYRMFIFLSVFLKQFYALISYHLMGYVLLQYHEEIGYQVDYEHFMENQGRDGKSKATSEVDELKAGVAVLIHCGKYNEAIERLSPEINSSEPNLELSEKFLQLLKMTNQDKRYRRYCLRHLDLLVTKEKKQKALVLFEQITKEKVGLPEAEILYTIGSWYRARNEFQKAMHVYAAFIKQYKKHGLQPAVYFELAKLLHEHGNNSTKAKQILKAVLKTYPEHKLLPEVKKYLLAVG